MANNWTEEQVEAINTRHCNLLVAAAAGSGKTAVLVERIIKIITDEKNPTDIDKLLVVTFTNAAAAEMRERIGNAISRELYKNPNSSLLQRQLVLLNKARITTIHSFCLDVIKNYFHLIDLDPKFRIADETEVILLKNETVEELFDEKYKEENRDEAFTTLVEGYCSNRDDANLVEMVLSLYNFAKSSPWPEKWLKEMTEAFNIGENYDFGSTKYAVSLLSNLSIEFFGVKRQIEKALKIISREETLEPYNINFKEDFSLIETSIHCSSVSWNSFLASLQDINFSTLKRCGKDVNKDKKEEVQKIRDNYKKQIKKIQQDMINSTGEDMEVHLKELYPAMKCLAQLTIDFDSKFTAKKREKGLIDFNDFEHLALKILTESDEEGNIVPSAAAVELRDKYEEILIDEYQDSNMVQEVLLNSISRKDSASPNLFMVGDVKQSIYRFRQAKPELFLDKYSRYSAEKDSKNRKILLFKNFRSRKNVIEGVNYIFKAIMSQHIGELNYNDIEALKLGANYSEPEAGIHAGGPIELHIIERNKPETTDMEEKTRNKEETENVEENTEDVDNIRLEAKMVARRIKELVENKENFFGVFDKDSNSYRKLQYKDIVILLRATEKYAPAFTEELKNFDIPVYADTGSGYFETIEIKTILALLQIIDNPLQDIPMLAVLRSPIAAFSEDELIDIRSLSKNKTFYEILKLAAGYDSDNKTEVSDGEFIIIDEDKFISKATAKKCNEFIVLLNNYRAICLYMPIDEFIWYLYTDTGYYGYAGAMPGGTQRQANLKILFQRAKAYENTSYKGLFNFINFINKLKISSKDMGSAKILGENEDVVRIMSIHKSKGLEFPVVFLCCSGKNFNQRDLTKAILFHYELGIGPDYVDYHRRISYPTIFKNAIKNKIYLESLSEEMRILYVALTRAKEKLIITGSTNDLEKSSVKWAMDIDNEEEKISENVILKGKNYLDWICPAVIKLEAGESLREKASIITAPKVYDEAQWQVKLWTREEVLCGEAVAEEVQGKETQQDNSIDEKVQDGEKTAAFIGEPQISKNNKLQNILLEIENNPPRTDYYEEIDRRLSWKYKYSTSMKLPSSVSVSELKRQYVDEEEYSRKIFPPALKKRPAFLEERKGLTPAEKGTAMHKVMQSLDYSLGFGEQIIKDQINKMIFNELLTEKQAEVINIKRIIRFFKSDLGKRMLASTELNREVPFVIRISAAEAYKDLPADQYKDENIMLQGAIDCYFEEEDGLVLVDYKTDYVTDDNVADVINKYASQLKYYSLALNKITGKIVKEKYLYLFYDGRVVKEV